MKDCCDCYRCISRTHMLKGAGSGTTGIMLLFDSPSKSEDTNNKVLHGRAGEYLRALIERAGFDIKELYMTYANKCYFHTKPTMQDLDVCRHRLVEDIVKVKQDLHLIIPFGKLALSTIYGKPLSINRYAGKFYKKDNVFIYPMQHYKLAYHDNNIRLQQRVQWKEISEYYKTINSYHSDRFIL